MSPENVALRRFSDAHHSELLGISRKRRDLAGVRDDFRNWLISAP
jgi:hypothetical protein